jgi:hypothetical protein
MNSLVASYRHLSHGRHLLFSSRITPVATLRLCAVLARPTSNLPSPGSPIAQPLPRATRRQRSTAAIGGHLFAPVAQPEDARGLISRESDMQSESRFDSWQ